MASLKIKNKLAIILGLFWTGRDSNPSPQYCVDDRAAFKPAERSILFIKKILIRTKKATLLRIEFLSLRTGRDSNPSPQYCGDDSAAF